MESLFLCPHCRAVLNPREYILFSARNGKGQRGLLLLSPELGDYSVSHHESFGFREGEHIDFLCPACHANLGLAIFDRDLAEVLMVDTDGNEYGIVFSQIAGKKLTLKLKNREVIESFGEDASAYINFWGEGPRY
ncbi:MAG: hypothetical protein JW861_11015 [Bacteroidales bacterium]|nr:hypothetical protein [Bacteroidales bacterium]